MLPALAWGKTMAIRQIKGKDNLPLGRIIERDKQALSRRKRAHQQSFLGKVEHSEFMRKNQLLVMAILISTAGFVFTKDAGVEFLLQGIMAFIFYELGSVNLADKYRERIGWSGVLLLLVGIAMSYEVLVVGL
jgi:hypothetical protein